MRFSEGALILGFALSAVVQAVVRKSTVVSLLGDDRPAPWRSRQVSAPPRPPAPMPPWRSPALCSARARTSPRRWPSRSPRPSSSSSSVSSWRC
ncbi:hypothetical protein ACFQ51_39030 [Streptomyces kaempferi]